MIVQIFLLCIILVNGNDIIQQSCGNGCHYDISEDRTTLIIQVTEGTLEEKEIGTLLQYNETVTTMIIECDLYPNDRQFFQQFTQLKYPTIRSKTIPKRLLQQSDIEQVIIGDVVEVIEERAFEGCEKLIYLVFEVDSKLKEIDGYAFKDCISLESTVLPKSLEKIDFQNVFQGCSDKLEIEFEENRIYEIENDIVYMNNKRNVIYSQQKTEDLKYVSIPSGVEVIEQQAFVRNKYQSISFPKSLKVIGESSFYGNDCLQSILIPENVETIGTYSFAFSNSLEYVLVISNSITIEDYAFYGCSNLRSFIFIGEHITIGKDAFDKTNVQYVKVLELNDDNGSENEIEFEDTIIKETCGTKCWYLIDKEFENQMIIYGDGNIEQIDMTNEQKTIITDIKIEEGIQSIEDLVFNNFTKLESIRIPSTVSIIGINPFRDCLSLRDVLFANENHFKCKDGMILTSDESELISYLCAIENEGLILPASVMIIGPYAIYKNDYLETLYLKEKIKTIGDYGISTCTSLTNMYLLSNETLSEIGDSVLEGCNIDRVYVGASYTNETFGTMRILKANGMTGDVYYYMTQSYVLIYGDGNMQNSYYGSYTEGKTSAPWKDLYDTLTIVKIEYGVKSVSKYAFYYNSYGSSYRYCYENLKTVEIGNSVTTIGDYAFYYSEKLTTLSIGNKVETIESNAFYYCHLLINVTIPDSVITIGDDAFRACYNLTNVLIGNNVTTIGNSAFAACIGLTTVTIPESVKTIGIGVFYSCGNLTNIEVSENNPSYCDVNGVLYTKAMNMILQYPTGKNETEYTILDNVIIIGGYSFYRSLLEHVTIPDTVTTIESHAFYACDAMKEIVLPEKITSIGTNAFSYSHYLSNMVYKGTREPECSSAIFNITKVDIVDVDVNYENTKFCGKRIQKVKGICGETEEDCKWLLSSDGYLKINGNGLMKNYSINNQAPWNEYSQEILRVDIEGVKTIGDYAFYQCNSIEEMMICEGTEAIGIYAISECSTLKTLILPSTLKTIGNYGIINCPNLMNIYHLSNETVIEIGDGVLEGCNGDNVYVGTSYDSSSFGVKGIQTASGMSGDSYYFMNETDVLIYGNGYMKNHYRDAYSPYTSAPWRKYVNSLEKVKIEYGVKDISEKAFDHRNFYKKINYVEIGNKVEIIGIRAFTGCDGVTELTIPDSVITIAESAFGSWKGLTNLTIGNSVTTIGYYAFGECSGLTELTIPDSMITIGERSFFQCTGLTQATIGEGVTTIELWAFYGCSGLTSMTLGNSVTTIGEYAFSGCGLTNVNIPKSVSIIGDSAFSSCSGLTEITMSNGEIQIGASAFLHCVSLKRIYFFGTTEPNCHYGTQFSIFCRENPFCKGSSNYNVPTDITVYVPTGYKNDASGFCRLTNVQTPEKTGLSGTIETECQYKYYSDGMIVITGNGEMPNWQTSYEAPWYDLKSSITEVKLIGVTSIADHAFDGYEGITSITIPDSVITIGVSSFQNCIELTNVTIGKSVTTIKEDAFASCKKLIEIEVSSDNPSYTSVDGVLYTKSKDTILHYPCSKGSMYEIEDGVTTIGYSSFSYCDVITDITIPNSVTTINVNAFRDSIGIIRLTLPDNIKIIGDWAFNGCTNLNMIYYNGMNEVECGNEVFSKVSSTVTVMSLRNTKKLIQVFVN